MIEAIATAIMSFIVEVIWALFRSVWIVIRELLETWIIFRDPLGIISWATILLGFGLAYLCVGVENWIAVWIFSITGVFGIVCLYVKYSGPKSGDEID
ncbi:MAG: hypothetical protein HON65_13635 [Rhodospirillales bacterium]|jgi:hypothetical protein|nr:hypothetical protein [Rhodospirillales bacterium]